MITPINLLDIEKGTSLKYSVCTMVNDQRQYERLLLSFAEAGFDRPEECEFIYVDNRSGNVFDGFCAVNSLLNGARGQYTILCHQDIELRDSTKTDLDRILLEMSAIDPRWGLLGNAGGIAPGRLAIRISDPGGQNVSVGALPARVDSLDENFLVVNSSARLAVSRDLAGFHLYGTELSLLANMRGYSAYVVDFHLTHLGGTSQDSRAREFLVDLEVQRKRLVRKYQKGLKGRWIQTPSCLFYISHSKLLSVVFNLAFVRKAVRRLSANLTQAPRRNRKPVSDRCPDQSIIHDDQIGRLEAKEVQPQLLPSERIPRATEKSARAQTHGTC